MTVKELMERLETVPDKNAIVKVEDDEGITGIRDTEIGYLSDPKRQYVWLLADGGKQEIQND